MQVNTKTPSQADIRLMRTLAVAAPVAIALLAIFIWTFVQRSGPLTWEEEVRLGDSRNVWVHREAEYRAPHELDQGPGESRYSLEFAHPATGETVKVSAALRASGEEMERAAWKTLMEIPQRRFSEMFIDETNRDALQRVLDQHN